MMALVPSAEQLKLYSLRGPIAISFYRLAHGVQPGAKAN